MFNLKQIFSALGTLLPNKNLQSLREEAVFHFCIIQEARNLEQADISFTLSSGDIAISHASPSFEATVQIMPPQLLRKKCEEILAETNTDKLKDIIAQAKEKLELTKETAATVAHVDVRNMEQYIESAMSATEAQTAELRLSQYRECYKYLGLDGVDKFFGIHFACSHPEMASDKDKQAVHNAMGKTEAEMDKNLKRIMEELDKSIEKLLPPTI